MKPAAALILLPLLAAPASAQQTLSLYGGIQGARSSDVTGRDTDGTRFDFEAEWDGKSFDMPPYWGVRYSRALTPQWAAVLDFTHSKLYATGETLADNGFGTLEFTDGLNVLTLAAERRFPLPGGLTPYLGAGLGVAVPHVESLSPAATEKTFDYQFAGPAAVLRAGLDYAVSPRWSVFAEYEASHVWLDVDLDGGGVLETDVMLNAANFGATFRF